MRLLVVLAVVITIIVILIYYHPQENVIDWWVNQKPGATTGTEVNQQPDRTVGAPFSDLAMAPDGTSPLQAPPAPPPGNPPPPQNPVVRQPPPQPKMPVSAKDKIYNMAKENEVEILAYQEQPIGNVLMTCRAKDKNFIFSFEDALLNFGIRDFDQVPGSFTVQNDPDGRRIVTTTFKIRYIPEYR